ncbi:ribonuclease R [Sporolituus thermophilus]|uniref:Ribonuclease R n=1 Tax=Sporolituus thermophilus DSM 23256 TaxID=1123285 RepID=A0A1G7N132_9FIRM|nr:ribonuclease R [Sporolituus thermophilus]SDF67758.1 ribonuclease R [Sporolituus thermophilus DSM 23256]
MGKTALRDKILNFMRNDAYRPLTAEDLAEEMGLKGKELIDFWPILHELEAEALIIKTRYGKYGVPERMNLIVGRFHASGKGYGFVVPDNPEEPDIYITADAAMTAMHNDRVVARIHRRTPVHGKKREGEIIRIVERANHRIVGTFAASRHYGFVVPDDPRLGQDIFVPKGERNGAKDNAKVVVEITKWPERQRSAEGRIVEVLGQKGDPGIEILSIITKHNLPRSFPPEVERAAADAPAEISAAELAGRRDLRDLPIVTIDAEDAKDLDDAVHVERLSAGRYLLGVHIADVSYYVRENTPLDVEARRRGTSVYLVDRVLPMLPPRLSNGICSLNAGEDRLTLSVHMEIDAGGRIVRYEIFPSVIRVHTRLSYNIVRRILVDRDENLRRQYADLVDHLEEMARLCHILRERRMRRGAIDFDFPEIKVKLDEEGRPVELVKRVRSLAESIIEEFMLAANETVAEHLHRLGVPAVYRVHEEPDPEKMEKLNDLLHNFGQRLTSVDDIHPIALQKVLTRIAGRPEERIISTVMLRSLKQARYEAENLGHFGLAARYYTHFTSPIRRYPDLIVHRILRETFTTGELSAKRREKLAKMLPAVAQHSSERERAAAEAERETVDLKKVEYMARFVGDEFPGIISGVTAFGLFVELDNGVEGLVHVSSMDDDYYQFAEEQYALIGERSKRTYRLGDAVAVRVVRVNPADRTIDLAFAAEPWRGEADKAANDQGRKGNKVKGKTGNKRQSKSGGKAKAAAKPKNRLK